MSLPDGFLDELRSRLSLAQVAGRKLTWDTRKSNQGKGDWWAPCPFHQEKTASFHVDDRKGYYYCFGCHAKGDAISFVRETENLGFLEAVEVLAREAGMTMPARDPKAQAVADHKSQLADVMELAVRHYRLQLKTATGAAARDYLEGTRGLGVAAWERWEIGFAPEGWQGLWDHLRGQGVPEPLIMEAGLAKPSSTGRAPYDTFRHRIMFPIRDGRGRAIAFGGRAMDPRDSAKYLNSPETPLFDKGRSLYNQARAREAAGKGQTLIVAEGYMDVIALAEAGFEASVAPLGTAVTEDQLRLLWRIHPEPVVALDGDQAGLRAAMRLIDLAMPMLAPEQSLRFAMLPEGKDPDDLLRAEGPGAVARLIEAAQPTVQLLWRRETEGRDFDSPERRAALDNRLRSALSKIRDRGVKAHYGEEIRRLRRDLFGTGRRNWAPKPWQRRGPAVLASTKASLLGAADGSSEDTLREAVILATLVTHPSLVQEFESALETLELSLPEHNAVRDALLKGGGRSDIEAETGMAALEKLFASDHVELAPGVRRGSDLDVASACVAGELAKLAARRGVRAEIEDAVEDFDRRDDEGLTWRLGQAARASETAGRGEDKGGDFEMAPNGVRLSRGERDALEKVLRDAGNPEET
ncbi:MAG: DNA primase [Pseudomonadota bacterium]